MAQLLLQKRAKADIPDNEGWTPLSVAAEDGYATVVRVLMASGADSSLRCDDDLPLEKALENGHVDVVRVYD